MKFAFLIPNDSFTTKAKNIAVVVGVLRADVMKIDRLNTGVDQRQQLVGLRNAIVIGIDPKAKRLPNLVARIQLSVAVAA